MNRKFEHGTLVSDQLTGFTGLITGYADYMTGCAQYLIQPRGVDNTQYPEAKWFDEGRLIMKQEKSFDPKNVQAEDNGCDYTAPTK